MLFDKNTNPVDPQRRLRCNEKTHPLLQGTMPESAHPWKDICSTQLADGTVVHGHDDWDIINDLENAGYIIVTNLVNGEILITACGWEQGYRLYLHKKQGGTFRTFDAAPDGTPLSGGSAQNYLEAAKLLPDYDALPPTTPSASAQKRTGVTRLCPGRNLWRCT